MASAAGWAVSEELEGFASTPITNPSGVIWTTINPSTGVAGEYNDYKKKKRGVSRNAYIAGLNSWR
jgi:hypothetical protein